MSKKNKFGFNYSYSSTSTFKQCPMRFKLQYLDREPILQTEALIKGNAVHNMVEEMINDLSKNKEITVDLTKYKYEPELVHFLELEQLRESKYENKDDYFINTCEEKIVDNDLTTVGKLDRVYKMWIDGEKVLLDYKTGKVRPKDYYYSQLALYTYMYNKKYPESKIKYWEIDWLTESHKYFIEEIDENKIEEVVKEYKSTIEEIEKTTEFKPKLTPLCMWCSVLHVCPMREQALKKFKGIADRKGLDVLENIHKSMKNREKVLKEKDKPRRLTIYSKVAGTTFTDFSRLDVHERDELKLVREPNNEFDKNAIKVMWFSEKIGYIKAPLAKEMAPVMDKGKVYKCFVSNITGGTDDKENKGINIRLECDDKWVEKQ